MWIKWNSAWEHKLLKMAGKTCKTFLMVKGFFDKLLKSNGIVSKLVQGIQRVELLKS